MLDAVVCATGFDAMTGSITRIRITGRGGVTIQDKWMDGPYLGLAVPGFPNMFNMVGPGGPSVLATMVTCAEQHGDWIADLLVAMRQGGRRRVETTPEAEAAWAREVADAASATLRSTCNSWYVGSNVPGKARVFMPYIGASRNTWRRVTPRRRPATRASCSPAENRLFARVPRRRS